MNVKLRSQREAALVGVFGCPVCGLSYVRDLPEDQKLHRARHAAALRILKPKPNKTLAKLHAKWGPFVPVGMAAGTPRWLCRRLYEIARVFRREMRFDFVQWHERDDDGKGYIITDEEGRALGGFVLRWRSNNPVPGMTLMWIWISPPYRRQGWLRRTWETMKQSNPQLVPDPPFSRAAAAFFATRDDIPDWCRPKGSPAE